MSTIILKINERSDKAKTFRKFLEDYVSQNSFVTIETMPNQKTRKAIEDGRARKVHAAKNAKDLFDSI